MGRAIAEQDWTDHPLGPIPKWPPALRAAVSMMLGSGFPCFLGWGDSLYTFYNDAYAPVLGNKIAIGHGRSLLGELWPEATEAARPLLEQALAGRTMFFENMPFKVYRHGFIEQTYFTLSYSPVLDENGDVHGVLGITVDTSDKVAALARLEESEERYRLSLESSGMIGTWTVDPETDITVIDDRFAKLFEVDPVLAKRGVNIGVFTEKIHSDDRPRVLAAVADAIQTGDRYDIDYRICQRSGADIWVTAKGKTFIDAYTGKKRFAGVAVDITDRKATEQKLIDANQRKDEFLAMLAHELRNPLAPISAAAELLQTAKLDEKRVRQTSEIIVRQVKHMTGLVNDLLDVSRVTRGLVELDRSPVDIRHVITEAIEQATPSIQSQRHHLVTDLTPDATIVSGDRKRLVQIVANVLQNAAKYTRPGGSITLKTEIHDQNVQIEVNDNGVGMTPDLASRVFDLFSQAQVTPDRTSGGLGLGLALVKSLVHLHGGTVTCASDGPGHGSTFTIYLPRTSADMSANATKDNDSTLQNNAKALRIMVVDDNMDAAAMLAMLLEMSGHHVIIEQGGAQALERAKVDRPQVFLLDIGLPEMDGNELAKRLRAQPENAKSIMVAVTGYGQGSDIDSTLAAGFNHHLVKPVDTAKLAAILAEVTST